MLGAVRGRLTYANVMATMAVFLALGGGAWALTRNSVGPRQIKPNAVRSSDVKNNALKGPDVNEATLGQVPSSEEATTADDATSAESAQQAVNAGLLDNLNSTDFLRANAVLGTANINESSLSGVNASTLDNLDSSDLPQARFGSVHLDDPPGDLGATQSFFIEGARFQARGVCVDDGDGTGQDEAVLHVHLPSGSSLAAFESQSGSVNVPSTGGSAILTTIGAGTNVVEGAWFVAFDPTNNVVFSGHGTAEINDTDTDPDRDCTFALSAVANSFE
jgi:hypothetical protein